MPEHSHAYFLNSPLAPESRRALGHQLRHHRASSKHQGESSS